MSPIRIEIEELQTQADQLASLLLACETAIRTDNFNALEFTPALTHLVELADNLNSKLKSMKGGDNESRN